VLLGGRDVSSKFTSLCLVFVLFYLTAFVVSAASEEQTEPEERTEPIGPEASFAADVVSGNAPLKVTFTAIGTGGIPASWHWDFGDGTNSENAQTITHTYANPGTYPVTLTVTNEAGSDTASDVYIMVYEVPVKPTAAFTAAVTTGEAPLTVEFVDTSTGGVTSRYWDFEDGTNSAASKTVIHTFNNPGTYTVTLTVTNDVGSDSLSKSDYITVSTASEPEVPAEPEPLRPEAAFTANTVSGDAPLKVTFTDTGTGGIPTSWYWDFGDGITSKHAQTATHTFTNSGIYTVTLTVTNEAGSDTASRTDYIKVHEAPAKPKAVFTADIKSGKVPLTVKFTDTSAGEVTSRQRQQQPAPKMP
jgi:PKD repeat protein